MQAKSPVSVLEQQDPIWYTIRREALEEAEQEPALASYFHANILNHDTLEGALSFLLANKLANPAISALQIREIIEDSIRRDNCIAQSVRADIKAVFDRDSACNLHMVPFLYYKGFHALQCYRISHCLWKRGRQSIAQFFQSHIAETFGVDIHPAAQIGKGIMFDHGTGIVIGETAVVADDVSIMQDVTLGGTGKEGGDRHPKIGQGCLISAGAKVLGNIKVGEGAKVGAGSVVLEEVPPHTTVVGVPARIVGAPVSDTPALDMNHNISADCKGKLPEE